MLFLISFSVIIFTENPNAGIITFTPISFLVFVVYLGHEFLNLEINSKTISIKKRVQGLENSHKELEKIVTTFYKLIIINFTSSKRNSFSEISQKHKIVAEDIIQFFNKKEITDFMDEIMTIQKRKT